MSITINLVEHLLSLGRKFQEMGRTADALQTLYRLSRFKELPSAVAEEIQYRLGQMHLNARRFKRARRHLLAAIRHQPDFAEYHFLFARALRADDQGDLDRAARFYRRALQMDPDNASCLVEYGLLAIQLGRTDDGLKRLRKAVDLAPNDPDVISQAATGFRQAGQADEARKVLQRGMFLNCQDGRFRKAWEGFKAEELLERQEFNRLQKERLTLAPEGPTLLKFVPPAKGPKGEAIPTILQREEPDPASDGSTDHRRVQ
jgi:Tfp pilus assembly protein PilF